MSTATTKPRRQAPVDTPEVAKARAWIQALRARGEKQRDTRREDENVKKLAS
jgi:hypothetical protein